MIGFLDSTLSKLSRSVKAIVCLSVFILLLVYLVFTAFLVIDAVAFYLERGEIDFVDYFLVPFAIFTFAMVIIVIPCMVKLARETEERDRKQKRDGEEGAMNDFLNSTLSKLSRPDKAIVHLSGFILVMCLLVIAPTNVYDFVGLYIQIGEVEITLYHVLYLAFCTGLISVAYYIITFLRPLKRMAEMGNDNMAAKEDSVMTLRPITLRKVLMWLLGWALLSLMVVKGVVGSLEFGNFFYLILIFGIVLAAVMNKKTISFLKSAIEVENKSAMTNKEGGMLPQPVKAVFSLSIHTMMEVLVLSLLCHLVMFEFYVIDKQISGGSIAYREAFADFLFFDVSSDKGQTLADISGAWKVFIILSFFVPWLYFWGKKLNVSAVKGVCGINVFCGVIGSIFLMYFYFDLMGFGISRLVLFVPVFGCFAIVLFMRTMAMMYGEKSGVNPETMFFFWSFWGYCIGLLLVMAMAEYYLFHLF